MRWIGLSTGLVSAMLVAGLVACGSNSPASSPAGPTQGARSIVVFAAASLQSAFTQIGEQFKAGNPGVNVNFAFAGSSELATQLTQGATADVFASADTAQMDSVAKAGLLAGHPTNFATNDGHRCRRRQSQEDPIFCRPHAAGAQRGGLPAVGAMRIGDPAHRRCNRDSSQPGQ